MSPLRVLPLQDIVVGQPRATSALQRALEADQIFPSLVFHGPGGVGKLTAALLLARVLLCRAPDERPCGACVSCRHIGERSLIHADVRLALPEKKSEFEREGSGSEGQAGIDPQTLQGEAVRNPVWSILIDRLRQGTAFLQRRPSESPRRILIVDQAHRMEAAAANALLKILEEPPAHALVVLITSSWHALLPTIRSRCQAVPFQLVPRTDIINYLIERRELSAEEAVLRAGLSGGRIGAALDLDLEAFTRRRDSLLSILDELARHGDPGLAVARAETIVQAGDSVEGDLEILMTLLRDLLVLGASPADEARLINIDIAPGLRDLSVCLENRSGTALEELETAIESIRQKGNRQLLVENFLIGLVPEAPGPPDAHARS